MHCRPYALSKTDVDECAVVSDLTRRVGSLAVKRLALSLALLSGLVIPATALAVLPGTNGKIVFASGESDNNDATAKLHFLDFPTTVSAPIITTPAVQHRHPTWSPDRTKIAYAAGPNATANYDIFILDLTQPVSPGVNPQNITSSNNVTEDRPAWSPDGTRIAYESEINDGSGQIDIVISPAAGGGDVNFTNTMTAGQFETKPAWTPDSQTLYYVVGDPNGANTMGIVRKSLAGGAMQETWLNGGASEFQPSISPDGTQMCFTQGTGFNGTADVFVAPIASPASAFDLSDNVGMGAANGDYNCTWSPDGARVAYVRGIFGGGALVSEPVPDEGATVTFHTDLMGNNANFDGNPDWAPDGRPACQDATVNVPFNGFATLTLSCADTGPAYEQSAEVFEEIRSGPSNGNLGGLQEGNPSTVIYTPNPNFSGTDTVTFDGTDSKGGSPDATITINVAGPNGGPGPGTDVRAAVISRLSLSSRRFRRGSALPRLSQRVRVGTTIRFNLDEAARASFTFHRMLKGRRAGRRCVKPNRRNRRARRCTRFVRAGSFSLNANAGANRVRFQGRLSRSRRLRPGKYRLTLGARDAAGNRSRSRTTTFTIVR
jgi:Tol biopolymer transport system component